ncbi:hypothetical protein PHYPSEUDO_010862 [Phytophthora pseudosyringae]|uniref:Uncharacterized protein n=1 Tax=Phytophthora pseudosyringae TaxID=221518 RepID=A0A8T1VCE7_9STRA|nr:hypothetical protein PHYPSEUDO_010862 [Phytophthora pseudosyringae]
MTRCTTWRCPPAEPKQYPDRASPYNLWLDNYTFTTPLTKMTVKLLVPVIKSVLTSHTNPLLPALSDQTDMMYPFKSNPSYALFESRASENVKEVLQRCRLEGGTYSGALSAAVIVAYFHASQKHHSVGLTRAFSKHVVKNSCSGAFSKHVIKNSRPGDAGELSVESLFLYVSTAKCFNYSMLHKLEDDDAKRLFQAYVAFGEHIGEVDQHATMADVLAQVEPLLE